MTKEELIEAANRPVTEEDVIEYRRWKREQEEKFQRISRIQAVPQEFERTYY